METGAARKAVRIASEPELAKTQALIQQVEPEKFIIGIWQEIVEEKLAGAKARADMSNIYLMEIGANEVEFETSAVAKAAEVRRLQEIDDAIVDIIAADSDDIERQIAAQEESRQEQRKKPEDLQVDPSDIGKPRPELTPTATP